MKKDLDKEFVTYPIAFDLKALGYAESPGVRLGGFDSEGFLHYRNISKDDLDAPLWQQAIEWFMEEHKIFLEPTVFWSCIGEKKYAALCVSLENGMHLFQKGFLEADSSFEDLASFASLYDARKWAVEEAIKYVRGKQ